jgi:predicted nucleic acid-binding protein
MPQRVLVDSNIFLDYYLDRKDAMLPLGEFAFRFIGSALSCNYFLLVCIETIEEISHILKAPVGEVLNLVFKELAEKGKIEIINPSLAVKAKARKIALERNLPFNDALFAVVAAENKVKVVTRDSHFLELKDIATAVKPEEL